MGKSLIRFRHLVRIFLLLHRASPVSRSLNQLSSEPLCHRLLCALSGEANDPTKRQGVSALRSDLHRYLIGRTPYPTRLNFKDWFDVVNGLLEHSQRVCFRPILNDLHRPVDNRLGNAFLTLDHHAIDKLRNHPVAINGIREGLSFHNYFSSGHCTLSEIVSRPRHQKIKIGASGKVREEPISLQC